MNLFSTEIVMAGGKKKTRKGSNGRKVHARKTDSAMNVGMSIAIVLRKNSGRAELLVDPGPNSSRREPIEMMGTTGKTANRAGCNNLKPGALVFVDYRDDGSSADTHSVVRTGKEKIQVDMVCPVDKRTALMLTEKSPPQVSRWFYDKYCAKTVEDREDPTESEAAVESAFVFDYEDEDEDATAGGATAGGATAGGGAAGGGGGGGTATGDEGEEIDLSLI